MIVKRYNFVEIPCFEGINCWQWSIAITSLLCWRSQSDEKQVPTILRFLLEPRLFLFYIRSIFVFAHTTYHIHDASTVLPKILYFRRWYLIEYVAGRATDQLVISHTSVQFDYHHGCSIFGQLHLGYLWAARR